MRYSKLILVFFISWCSVQLAAAQEKATLTQLELGLLRGKSKTLWSEEIENNYPDVRLLPIGLGWRGFIGDDIGSKWMGGLNTGFGTTFLEKRERTEWFSTWHEGGVYFHPFLGISMPAKKGNWALTASIGYKWQPSSYLEGSHSQSETQPKIHPFWTRDALPEGFSSLNKISTQYHSLSFQVGILF